MITLKCVLMLCVICRVERSELWGLFSCICVDVLMLIAVQVFESWLNKARPFPRSLVVVERVRPVSGLFPWLGSVLWVFPVTWSPNLSVIIQSRNLSIFMHIARTDDVADSNMILTAPPPHNWRRPPGRRCIMWLNTVQRDLRAYNLTLNEAVNLAQNRPLWRLMSMYGATHS